MTSTPVTSTPATDPAVTDWLRATARPVDSTASDHTGPDLDELAHRLGAATVIGLGESTRFSRQTYGIRERLFRRLVRDHGVRALAIQDGARSGERLDAYARTGAGSPETLLELAWRPLRTRETVATARWVRAYNRDHPDDPITILGVKPPHAEVSDYDAISEHVRADAPWLLDAVDAHLAPIRTAHEMDEHVQRHRGVHPGRPFAEHARDAFALLTGLPAGPGRDSALRHAHTIVRFHEQSVAGSGGFAADERPAAERILEVAAHAKLAYWDGISHVAGSPIGIGAAGEDFHGAGSHLRAALGARYVAVAIGFHHGHLGLSIAPDPDPGLVDAALGTVESPAFTVDLHGPAPEAVDRWRRGPARLRVVSGVYDPGRDAEAVMAVRSLVEAFDVLAHVRETTPVAWLPDPVRAALADPSGAGGQ